MLRVERRGEMTVRGFRDRQTERETDSREMQVVDADRRERERKASGVRERNGGEVSSDWRGGVVCRGLRHSGIILVWKWRASEEWRGVRELIGRRCGHR